MNPEKQKTNRQLSAEATKKKLIECSLKLIGEYGYDNVKIEDICKAANVSTGAFYHHLSGKAGIIIEGYSQCDDYFNDLMKTKAFSNNIRENILEYIDYQMQYAEGLGIDILIQIYKAQLTNGNDFFLSNERGIVNGLQSIIENAKQKNKLTYNKGSKEICMELLMISRGIIYNWCQSRGCYDLRKQARDILGNYLFAYGI